MLVPERDAGKPQERKHLQAITVVVRDAEQLGVGVEGEHDIVTARALEHSRGSKRPVARMVQRNAGADMTPAVVKFRHVGPDSPRFEFLWTTA